MSSILKPLFQMNKVLILLSPWFWRKLSSLLLSCMFPFCLYQVSLLLPLKMMEVEETSVEEETRPLKMMEVEETSVEEETRVSLFDLPDLALECILEMLPPDGLCNMAGVCTYLKGKCTSDYLWQKYMDHKWGRVVGDAAYEEWKAHISSAKKRPTHMVQNSTETGIFGFVQKMFHFSWTRHHLEPNHFVPRDSIMSLYLAIEGGKFWFPAQVCNRENGHIGFIMSCYDAKLCYDSNTNTFQARYSSLGRRTLTEENIHWDRIREPAVDASSYVLYISECLLNDLNPGDYVEIQWRRNKEFPYGWWFSVVGHLDSCIRNANYCHCKDSDTVILEFKQYIPGSRCRRTRIRRTDHREEGNEADGFYGGIRKVYKATEISTWKRLCPFKIWNDS